MVVDNFRTISRRGRSACPRESTTPRTWGTRAAHLRDGERDFDEEATTEDIAFMREEIRDAIRAGAIGFTTSRTEQSSDARRAPGREPNSQWDESAATGRVMGELGAGIFENRG